MTVRIRGQDQPAVAQVAEVDRKSLLVEMLKVYRGMPRRTAASGEPLRGSLSQASLAPRQLAEKQLPDMVLVRLQVSTFPKS